MVMVMDEQGWFIAVCTIGLFANAVLLTILFKYEKGWSLGKTMLVFLHLTEVALLFCQLPPYIAVITTAPTVPGLVPVVYVPGYTTECAPSAIVLAFAITLEPYILAMLAYVRWDVVRSSKDLSKKGKQPLPIRRMIAILLAAITINTIIGEVTNLGEYQWSPLNICLKDGGERYYRDITLLVSFLICAPFIGYCYANVIRTLNSKDAAGAGYQSSQNKKRSEAIRLLVVLTVVYYLSHTAFFVAYGILAFAEVDVVLNLFGLTGVRLFSIIYLTYAMLSPILSIALTQRYRIYALRMFRITGDGSTLSGSDGTNPSSKGSHDGSVSSQRTKHRSKKYTAQYSMKIPSVSTNTSVMRGSGSTVASSNTSWSSSHEVPGGSGFTNPTAVHARTLSSISSGSFAAAAAARRQQAQESRSGAAGFAAMPRATGNRVAGSREATSSAGGGGGGGLRDIPTHSTIVPPLPVLSGYITPIYTAAHPPAAAVDTAGQTSPSALSSPSRHSVVGRPSGQRHPERSSSPLSWSSQDSVVARPSAGRRSPPPRGGGAFAALARQSTPGIESRDSKTLPANRAFSPRPFGSYTVHARPSGPRPPTIPRGGGGFVARPAAPGGDGGNTPPSTESRSQSSTRGGEGTDAAQVNRALSSRSLVGGGGGSQAPSTFGQRPPPPRGAPAVIAQQAQASASPTAGDSSSAQVLPSSSVDRRYPSWPAIHHARSSRVRPPIAPIVVNAN